MCTMAYFATKKETGEITAIGAVVFDSHSEIKNFYLEGGNYQDMAEEFARFCVTYVDGKSQILVCDLADIKIFNGMSNEKNMLEKIMDVSTLLKTRGYSGAQGLASYLRKRRIDSSIKEPLDLARHIYYGYVEICAR